MDDAEPKVEHAEPPKKPSNKITKFADSDSSGSDNDDDDKDDAKDNNNLKTEENKEQNAVASTDNGNDESRLETENAVPTENPTPTEKEKPENQDIKEAEALGPPAKRQCTNEDAANIGSLSKKVETKSVDKLIEAELAELGDKSKVSPRVYFILFYLHLNVADRLLIYIPKI